MQNCIFCGVNVEVLQNHRIEAIRFKCPLCLEYGVSQEAIEDKIIDSISPEDRILFSAYVRENSERGNPLALLSSDILSIPEIVSPFKKLTAIDKVNKVICFFAENSESMGGSVPLDLGKDFVKFYCKSPAELRLIREHLRETGVISITSQNGMPVLTIEGWKKYEALKEVNLNSKKAFVAMSFSDGLEGVFEGAIEPACDECELNAVKIDLVEHNEKICDRIISEIKESRLLIADFTHQKQNVYFEAGFALGLGIKVIWICSEEEKEKLHFDTRQYNHIFWKDIDDLKKQLVNRIKAVV